MLGRCERVAELSYLALERFDVRTGGLRPADALRAFVAGLSQALYTNLQLLATRLERDIALAIERETAAREVGDDGIEVLAKQFGIEHI